ncbi:hypothetical protein [Pseudomonas sp. MF6747]|uniref:hypothetical protein n=1 Tax=Pseudomonas sp. MF6747 TaxID=2797527 RepID=UPI00190C25AD|nr:hypothetical protein [Pseudomonas sp. MF6747]MBK3508363.1 hypothetical protein [Pseudomonas sp. MF6747]
MSKSNECQIDYDYYILRLASKQKLQLEYLAKILETKSLKYTIETLIESAFINCYAYQERDEDFEDEDENEEGA